MTADNYAPTTSLSSYYTSRDARSPARHWTTEKLIHDLAAIGLLSFFEGPGPNPMELTGASTSKLWLDVDAGVTSTAGTFKRYSGTGATTDEANWVAVTPAGYLLHLGDVTPSDAVEEYGTKAALEAATVDGGVTHVRIGGYTSSGDGGAALYDRVLAEPSHAGKIQSDDGAWWELAEVFPTPYHFGAQINGSTNDSTAFTNFLNFCSITGRKGIVPPGVMPISAISITLAGDLHIECAATLKNRLGSSMAAALITIAGASKAYSLKWKGGTLDIDGGAYSGIVVSQCNTVQLSIDEAYDITCTTSSPSTTSAIYVTDCNDVVIWPGFMHDFEEGTSTQGSIPRCVSIGNTTEAVIHGGLFMDFWGAFVFAGNQNVTINGTVARNSADNGIYNVETGSDRYDNGTITAIGCVFDAIDEPIVHAGGGTVRWKGGVISNISNAIGMQDAGPLVVDGATLIGKVGGSNIFKTRSSNTSSTRLEVRNCDITHEGAFAMFDFSTGALGHIHMTGNHIRWYHNSAYSPNANLYRHNSGDSFEIKDNLWEFFDNSANIASQNWNLTVPTVTKLSAWTGNRIVNRTTVAGAVFRVSGARQQLVSFDQQQSFSSSATETAVNSSSLTSAEPRNVWGTAAPSNGYWQAGSRVWNVAPSAGGTMGWVCVTAGSPGTWKTFGAIAA